MSNWKIQFPRSFGPLLYECDIIKFSVLGGKSNLHFSLFHLIDSVLVLVCKVKACCCLIIMVLEYVIQHSDATVQKRTSKI